MSIPATDKDFSTLVKSLRAMPHHRHPTRAFVVIAALALLAGSTITLTIKRGEIRDMVAHASASRAVRASGYKLAVLDVTPAIRCKAPGQGFVFTATRGGHLYAGGGCVTPFHPDETLIVTLPPLR